MQIYIILICNPRLGSLTPEGDSYMKGMMMLSRKLELYPPKGDQTGHGSGFI